MSRLLESEREVHVRKEEEGAVGRWRLGGSPSVARKPRHDATKKNARLAFLFSALGNLKVFSYPRRRKESEKDDTAA